MASGWYKGGYRSGYVGQGYTPGYPPPDASSPVVGPPLTGLKLWLRAGRGITLSGSNVTAWADQSGNGNDFTASTDSGTTLPVLITGGSGINGKPVVRFTTATGTDLACYFSGPLDLSTGTGATIIYVTRSGTDSPAAYASVLGWNGGGTQWNFGVGSATDGYGAGWAGPDTSVGFGDIAPTPSTVYYGEYLYDKTLWTINSPISNTAADTSFPSTSITAIIGSGSFGNQYNGDTGDILVYDQKLTSGDLATLHAYITSEYAITP